MSQNIDNQNFKCLEKYRKLFVLIKYGNVLAELKSAQLGVANVKLYFTPFIKNVKNVLKLAGFGLGLTFKKWDLQFSAQWRHLNMFLDLENLAICEFLYYRVAIITYTFEAKM